MSEARTVSQVFNSMTYRELLKSESWRTFANDFKDKRGNACSVCKKGKQGVQVAVHHFFYDGSRLPWNYRDDELTVLCAACHQAAHDQLRDFRKFVLGRLTPRGMAVLNGALSVGLDHNDPLELVHAIAEMCASPASVKRFATAFNPTALNARAAGGQA